MEDKNPLSDLLSNITGGEEMEIPEQVPENVEVCDRASRIIMGILNKSKFNAADAALLQALTDTYRTFGGNK